MRSLRLGASLALLALPAVAQAPQGGPPVRVRGTVERLGGDKLMLKSRDRSDVALTRAPNFGVRGFEKRKLSDLKLGAYLASTGRPGADGKLHAVEVRVIPEALRGAGEGRTPWELASGDEMTNATVSGITTLTQGTTVKVSYKGTRSEYGVDPGTLILSYTQGDVALLKPGAAVLIIAQKKTDGSLTSNTVTAEANGIKPPI